MKARRTPETNTVLTLPGPDGEPMPDRDLPATRILAYDPERGQTEKDARAAFETHWSTSPAERQAIIAGAPVIVVIHGAQHPPISVNVGTPAVDVSQSIIDTGHAGRALAKLYATLTETLEDNPRDLNAWPDAGDFLDIWATALEETRDQTAAPEDNGRAPDDA